jgi:hypothetical protein
VTTAVTQQRVELPYEPYPHQRAAHALRLAARFVVLVWHRRAGKTVFSILELLLAACACTRERGRFAYIAPQLKQAKAVAWDYLKKFARLIPGTTINESELYIELASGHRVRLFGADNPDSLRGIYLDGVVLDEVADMKPNLWEEIIRPALADRLGWALFIGTPKGINLFSKLYYDALKDPSWGADLKRAGDTNVIDAGELERARKEMSESRYAQEFDCDFAAAVDDALIKLDLVLKAQERTYGRRDYEYAPRVLGVDVARYGADNSVIIGRQGLVCFKPTIIRHADVPQVASMVAQKAARWEADGVFVDIGGVGAGVYDMLKRLKVPGVVPVDFGSRPSNPRFENKRAEMWWDMAQWVPTAALPGCQELVQDLTALRYTFANVRGKLQLESKDDLRDRGLPSPDVGDALACTFFAPVTPKAERGLGAEAAQAADYDPYARSET